MKLAVYFFALLFGILTQKAVLAKPNGKCALGDVLCDTEECQESCNNDDGEHDRRRRAVGQKVSSFSTGTMMSSSMWPTLTECVFTTPSSGMMITYSTGHTSSVMLSYSSGHTMTTSIRCTMPSTTSYPSTTASSTSMPASSMTTLSSMVSTSSVAMAASTMTTHSSMMSTSSSRMSLSSMSTQSSTMPASSAAMSASSASISPTPASTVTVSSTATGSSASQTSSTSSTSSVSGSTGSTLVGASSSMANSSSVIPTSTTTTTTTFTPARTQNQKFQIKVAGSLSTFLANTTLESAKEHMKSQIASQLSINESRIVNVRLTEGSIIVAFEIIPAASASEQTIASLEIRLRESVSSGNLTLTDTSGNPLTVDTTFFVSAVVDNDEPEERRDLVPIIVGCVVGVFCLVLIFIIIIVVVLKKKQPNKHNSFVSPSSSNGRRTQSPYGNGTNDTLPAKPGADENGYQQSSENDRAAGTSSRPGSESQTQQGSIV